MSKANETTEVMYVRIPKKLANTIREVKKEKDFQSWSTALLYWIQEQRDDRINSRLMEIEHDLKNWVALTMKAHQKSNFIAQKLDGDLELRDKEGQEITFSKLLQGIDKVPKEKMFKIAEGK